MTGALTMAVIIIGFLAACAVTLRWSYRRDAALANRRPVPTYEYDAPDSIELLIQAGMLNKPIGMADPELSMILVVTDQPDDPDASVMCGVVAGVHEAGRLIGILQAQADTGRFRIALDAAAEQGHMWAVEQLRERQETQA